MMENKEIMDELLSVAQELTESKFVEVLPVDVEVVEDGEDGAVDGVVAHALEASLIQNKSLMERIAHSMDLQMTAQNQAVIADKVADDRSEVLEKLADCGCDHDDDDDDDDERVAFLSRGNFKKGSVVKIGRKRDQYRVIGQDFFGLYALEDMTGRKLKYQYTEDELKDA